MKKWNMIIDVARCHDCNNCFLACKDESVGNDFPPYSLGQPWHGHRWMNIMRQEEGQYPRVRVCYLPMPCLQCEDAPCLTRDGAVYKRGDGVVVIDPQKAAGRREIVDSCPYGAIYWNDESKLAQKCTGCIHLLEDGWTDTRCTQVCPTEALKFLWATDEEMAARAAEEGLEAYRPELAPKARVFYKNLHRYTRAFVAAGVVYGDTDECAAGAVATLALAGANVGEAVAGTFGDFYIDKLETGKRYTLTIGAPGYRPIAMTVDLETSTNLGTIVLQAG
jgi:Fe-S-cluster-containing dehydrogenase component